MKQLYFYLCLFFCLLLTANACRHNTLLPSPNGTIINLGDAVDHATPFTLEDMGYDAVFVPLETSEVSLISANSYWAMWKDRIIVSSKGQPVKVFDANTGKYLNKIGGIGQGPEEYIPIANFTNSFVWFWVDQTLGTVYVQPDLELSTCQFKKFTIDGRYVGNFKSKDISNGTVFYSYPLIDNNTIVFYNNSYNRGGQVQIAKIDTKTDSLIETIATYTQPYSFGSRANSRTRMFMGEVVNLGSNEVYISAYAGNKYRSIRSKYPAIWKHNRRLSLKEEFIDTIYTVQNKALHPRYTLNFGKYHWPYEKRFDSEGTKDFIAVDYIYENDRTLFFHLHQNYYSLYNSMEPDNNQLIAFFDKVTKQVRVQKGDSIRISASNALSIRIQGVSSTGTLYAIVQPEKLVDNPLFAHIKEDDNPILVLLKLK